MNMTIAASLTELSLTEGTARNVGDGLMMIENEAQNIVLSRGDLRALIAAEGLTVTLEDGVAEYVGDDLWMIQQHDEAAMRDQGVLVNRDDFAKLLAAA